MCPPVTLSDALYSAVSISLVGATRGNSHEGTAGNYQALPLCRQQWLDRVGAEVGGLAEPINVTSYRNPDRSAGCVNDFHRPPLDVKGFSVCLKLPLVKKK